MAEFSQGEQIRMSKKNRYQFSSPSINIITRNVVRLASFYERLGFRETFRTPLEGTPAHVEMTLDRFTIGVSSLEAAVSDHGLNPNLNGRPVIITLMTDDPDRDYARLISEGAPSLSPPSTFHANKYELRSAYIADPDGNPINLFHQISNASEKS
jgi:catechol 2,3-dioxygenase-like lactoylglutathione lyase family enzyme